ncbi:MAG: motility associated factor glycosyltransferase family protein [Deltaproteobacteria bacterium]
MGHCIDYIREKRLKYKQILIIEPFNNVFMELLKKRDIASLLNMKNLSVTLFKDPHEIIPQIIGMTISSRKVNVLYHLSYRSIYQDLFQEIARVFSSEKMALETTVRTLDILLYEWTQNQLKSIQKQYPRVSFTNKLFKDMPAVIISAGPSLEKRIDEIKEIQDRALIIAPGSGAKVCSNSGIKAHVALAIDSSILVADILRNSKLDILLGSNRLHPEVYSVFPNKIYKFTLSNELIAKYYQKYSGLPSDDDISDYSSVSCAAVDLAVKMGCNPIILVGQDLCYYDNREHAGEEENSLAEERKAAWIEAQDINGNAVYTDDLFLTMRRDIEVLALRNMATIINASEAGLGIPGVENQKFRDVITQYIDKKQVDISESLAQTLNQIDNDSDKTDNVSEFFHDLILEIEKIEKINSEKLEELRRLNSSLEKGFKDNRLASNLLSIEEKNKELLSNDLYREVIQVSVERFLLIYFAGSLYNAKSEQDPRAKLFYESKVYELTTRYAQIIKQLTKNELDELAKTEEKGFILYND